MTFLLLLAVIGLGIWVINLNNRLTALEQGNAPKAKSVATKPKTKTSDQLPWEPAPKTVSKKTDKPSITKTKPAFNFEAFLGEKLFPILGATSMVLAIGFFTIWAFANGWVGPMGRIALGIAFSVALIGLGEFMKNKYPNFFQYLTATGIAGLIITTFVARYNYEFISPLQSLVLYTLEAGAGVFFSLRYNSRILGNFAVLSGLVAPLLTNTSEPNVLGLLAFLTIICAAGFFVAAYKKWPEIYAVLIVFILGFELMSVEAFKDNEQLISPLALLGFIFVLHTLIGAGGIARLYRENVAQPIKACKGEDVYEIILFSLSLLTGNLLAFNLFDYMNWDYFGFLVAAQALVLYGLAELFRSKGWSLFHVTSLAASLTFVLFSTIWQLYAHQDFLLALVLILEGALLCFVGQTTHQKIFDVFGRIALFLAFTFVFQVEDVMSSMLLVALLIAGLIYSVGKPQNDGEKVWMGVSLFLSTLLVFYWSLELANLPETVQLSAPVAWSLLLIGYGVHRSSLIAKIAGAIVFGAIALMSFALVEGASELLDGIIITAWVLVNGFTLYYLQKTTADDSAINQVLNYLSLALMTISVILLAGVLTEEPIRTMVWLGWASLCLAIGISQKWVEIRYAALIVFLIIIAKLYLIDVWQWETWVRFMAFFALGLTLLAVGFFYQKIWSKK